MSALSSRVSLALLALMLIAAPAARAQGGGNSTISGNRINLGGFNPGTAGDQNDHCSPGTTITVTVRDIGNNPIPGIAVVLDFSPASSDLKLALTQSFMGETVDCATARVSNVTDALGRVTFAVRGSRVPGPAHAPGSVRVFADNYLLGNLSAGLYDQDGANGVSLPDLGLWGADYFSSTNPDRSDYNGNGLVSLADLSLFSACYFSGCSSASGPSACP
jgi:hypothetical protein